jgi:hypothetical protein
VEGVHGIVSAVSLPVTLEGHDFGGALLGARRSEVELITDRLMSERAIAIVGEFAVGKTRLLSRVMAELQAASNVRSATVDLRDAASDTRLAWRWMRALARAVAGPVAFSHMSALPDSMWPGTTRAAALEARRLLGDDLEWALSDQPTRLSPAEARTAQGRAREATLACAAGVTTVLAWDHLEATLDPPRPPFDVSALLWELRGLSQEADQLHLALVTHPAIESAVVGPKAAYAGAPVVNVSTPPADVWMEAVAGEPALERTLDDVLQRTRGHIPSTVLLLHALMADPGTSVGRAFDALATTQVELANRSLLHASALHRLGAQVLTTLARGDLPYGANPDARSPRDIAQALRALWRAGLVTRPEERRWEVADPFVARLLGGSDLTGALRP